jgi:hypothetical protein
MYQTFTTPVFDHSEDFEEIDPRCQQSPEDGCKSYQKYASSSILSCRVGSPS